MGLWSKGINRSKSNRPRLETTPIDQNMIDRIIEHLNMFRVAYQQETGDHRYIGTICSCKCEDKHVSFKLWGIEVDFFLDDKMDIPTIMWKIRNWISDRYHTRIFSMSRNILGNLVRNIEMNELKYKSGDWDRDDTFLDINPNIFKRCVGTSGKHLLFV